MSIPNPPTLPSDSSLSAGLTNYLRTFATWARKGFDACVPKDVATQHVLLQSPAGKVFVITVTDAGVLQVTNVALGGPNP